MNSFIQTLARGAMVGLLAAVTLAGCSNSGPVEPETPGTAPHMRLVTTDQYINSLLYVFGPSVHVEGQFSPAKRTDGLLATGAAHAGVSTSQAEQYQRVAGGVAAQVVNEAHRSYLIPCEPASEYAADNACAARFLSQTGRLLFRRPLTEAELTEYVSRAESGATTLNDFYKGLAAALEGMLISPELLFVIERAEPDPNNPGQLRLDAYSLASRLSFFLWNGSPDDDLLKAAESGELQSKEGLALSIDRMLASPRLVSGMRAFFDDMFGFDDFDTLSKDPLIYPAFTSVTAVAAREQTLRTVIDHLVVNEQDYRDLYTMRKTFMSPALATLYGMPAPKGWTPYTFPDDSLRSGLLTQISFLALHAHPGRSSPTLRGKALREVLLCQHVPPPPPGIDFSALTNPDSHYPTQRDRVSAHLESPSCAGCHKITDPMGLAMENFSGDGRYQEKENGVLIDASGNLDGIEFDNVVGLGEALRNNEALPSCLVQRLYAYGSGETPGVEENALLAYFNEYFATEGYRLPVLLRKIAFSDSFSRVTAGWAPAPEEQEPNEQDAEYIAEQQQTVSNNAGLESL